MLALAGILWLVFRKRSDVEPSTSVSPSRSRSDAARLSLSTSAREHSASSASSSVLDLIGRTPLVRLRRLTDGIADGAAAKGLDPQPVSGRQEILENLVNRYV